MSKATFSGFVRCSFYPAENPVSDTMFSTAEVFFGQTEDFPSGISSLNGFINKDDQLKAGRLFNSEDRKTVLICYTMLRMILSKKLNMNPHEISYLFGTHGKPGLKGDPLFFSISHTRNSFSFAISDNYYIGLDVEEINRDINFETIIRRFFSGNEGEYILNSKGNSRDRFFLLWTRKEALLKAIGTGIIPQLSNIEVHNPVNLIERNSIDDLKDASIFNHHYIYSKKLQNYYLSVAFPREAKISLYNLNEKNINTYFQ
jgi:phosphopantetheine--protein transferase-like protein